MVVFDQEVLFSKLIQVLECFQTTMNEEGSLSRTPGVVVCKECRHVAKDEDRHKEHIMEARHIHAFRNLAYR